MTLKRAQEIRSTEGGDYPDLKKLAEAGDVLAVFRLIDFLPRTATSKPNVFVYPVRADLLICSGPDSGRAWFNQSFQGNAVSPTLRGAKDEEPPKNSLQAGENEYSAVIKQPVKGYAIVNAPSAEQHAQIDAVYRGFPEQQPSGNGVTSNEAKSSSSVGEPKTPPWKR